jgi:surfactin synthase thioesterase subunit/DNA-binding MarR family transcriptional regulator
MVKPIYGGAADDADLWIRTFHPASAARGQLACFPHAGGPASYYLPISRALSPSVEVLAVQYPGRQDRRGEKGIDSIGELADAITPHLLRATDRPLALFGHSMGATLAFEVALRLEQQGVQPLALFVSGRRAPTCVRDEYVHLGDDDALVAEIRRLDGTDAQLLKDEDIRKMALPAIRTDYTAVETYRYEPGPPLRTPIYAHIGDQDPKVTVEEATAWRERTSGHFELQIYPGGHFYLNEHVDRLLQSIEQVISSASAASVDHEREDLIRRITQSAGGLGQLLTQEQSTLFTSSLTLRQLTVVMILSRQGSSPGQDLAQALGVRVGTVTGLVDRLVGQGLVHRYEDPQDRRVRRVELTDAGANLAKEINNVGLEPYRRTLRHLDTETLRSLELITGAEH